MPMTCHRVILFRAFLARMCKVAPTTVDVSMVDVLVLLVALVLACCGAPREAAPPPPEGIHWDATQGVLSARRGKRLVTMEFARLPAGKVTLGGWECARTVLPETPARTQRIARGLWLGVTEVTREQWHALAGEPPPTAPQLPMTRISWNDVHAFLRQLEAATGVAFRLPTEAEWEYACRAGSAAPWPWEGDHRQLPGFGWFAGNAGRQLHLVARRQPNAFGLYDMHGNAAEWTQDSSTVANRVLRGGHVLSTADGTACTCRYHFPAEYGYQYAGFRLALD